MFHYEYEKRAPSREWGAPDRGPRRPLPPRPEEHIPSKTTVPLKVWIIASASCFAVCAALVLATVVITKWGTEDQYTTRELYPAPLEPIYSNLHRETTEETKDDFEKDLPVIQKLPLFKNIVTRDKNKSLLHKPQMHPIHEVMYHEVRKIEKKDQPKVPENEDINIKDPENDLDTKITVENIDAIPDFKPIDVNNIVKLPDNFVKYKEQDYQEYYDDVNLYDDYIQSNSLTNYLMEKVQELHDWVTKDPDFEAVKNSTTRDINTDFGKVLNALNSSLVEGNVSILMTTLKNLYFGEVSSKSLLSNTTDLVSFGILSLDVMLLHNIQVMAWESQEAARNKMMRDPDVFTFNALFLDPGKMATIQNEIQYKDFAGPYKRINPKQDEDDFGRSLMRNILDVGISTARAAVHLGKAYKNTRTLLNQISNKEVQNLSRDLDSNTQVLNHLQASYGRNSVASSDEFTELDCIWMLYCRNLVATSKLNPPYGTMARINGVALRMLAGELSADRAIDTLLYEAFTGWKELDCNDMFPRCSKVDAASIVMDRIIQPKRQANEE